MDYLYGYIAVGVYCALIDAFVEKSPYSRWFALITVPTWPVWIVLVTRVANRWTALAEKETK